MTLVDVGRWKKWSGDGQDAAGKKLDACDVKGKQCDIQSINNLFPENCSGLAGFSLWFLFWEE